MREIHRRRTPTSPTVLACVAWWFLSGETAITNPKVAWSLGERQLIFAALPALSGMIADHRRNLGLVGKIEMLPILQICPRSSQMIGDTCIYEFEFSLVGKIWDGRETVKSQTVWDFPTYENQA